MRPGDRDHGETVVHVVVRHEGDAVVAVRDAGVWEGEVNPNHSDMVLWCGLEDEMADCGR